MAGKAVAWGSPQGGMTLKRYLGASKDRGAEIRRRQTPAKPRAPSLEPTNEIRMLLRRHLRPLGRSQMVRPAEQHHASPDIAL